MTEHPHYDLSQPPAHAELPEPTPPVMFTIRVVYKSGFVQDFVTSDFVIGKGEARWSDDTRPRPLLMGVDEIAAVFQLDQLDED